MPAATNTTTQSFLEIFDITNNLVILKNGTVSVLLTVSAINFGLLAEEEQDAVIYAYAGLLNSLNYSIQVVVHSQTKDVTKYLSLLKEREETAFSPLIRKRIQAYREFVANLIQERNVLDKKFYVIIPAGPLELGFVSPKGFVPGQATADVSSMERSVVIEKAKNVLEPRRDHLISQFARIGLYARELETQEIIQLFYIRYNPEAAEGQQLDESSSYTTPMVGANLQASMFGFSPQTPGASIDPPSPTTPVATESAPLVEPTPTNPADPPSFDQTILGITNQVTAAPDAAAINPLDVVGSPNSGTTGENATATNALNNPDPQAAVTPVDNPTNPPPAQL